MPQTEASVTLHPVERSFPLGEIEVEAAVAAIVRKARQESSGTAGTATGYRYRSD